MTRYTTYTAVALLLTGLVVSGCKPSQPATTTRTAETTPPVTIDYARRGERFAQDTLTPDPSGVTPDQFCPLYSAIACRKMFACSEPAVIAVDAANLQFSDEPSCAKAMMRFCGSMMLPGVGDSVREGRVVWDKASFGQCFKTWRTQGCTPPLADLPAIDACRKANTGTVKAGGTCTTAFDCAEGAKGTQIICAFPESGPGLCTELGNEGVSCNLSSDCRNDLRCREDRCQPIGQEGEACRFKVDCALGLLCPEATSICTNPLKR